MWIVTVEDFSGNVYEFQLPSLDDSYEDFLVDILVNLKKSNWTHYRFYPIRDESGNNYIAKKLLAAQQRSDLFDEYGYVPFLIQITRDVEKIVGLETEKLTFCF
jgi:hypothetical protein